MCVVIGHMLCNFKKNKTNFPTVLQTHFAHPKAQGRNVSWIMRDPDNLSLLVPHLLVDASPCKSRFPTSPASVIINCMNVVRHT